MRQTELFSKTTKTIPKDEISKNAQYLIRGGFIEKLMAGTYSMLPMGQIVYSKIEDIIREEMDNIGGQEIFLPSMHPRENWEKTGRWGSFDALIYLGLDEERNMVLGPTHEEVISPLAKKYISSYNDLPRYVYQFQNKFRNEKRAKSGLLRLREFIMKDLYSFHATQADLDEYYEKAKGAYSRIFKRLGLMEQTYLTYASGGAFSKYSHEFQTITIAGEDMIYICDICKIAVNREIIEDLSGACPVCGSSNLREARAIEVGNIFKLGTRFSEPFELYFTDKNGESNPVIMGCYGLGLQRIMGTIVEVHHDEQGIIWPEAVAPFKVNLVEVSKRSRVSDRPEEPQVHEGSEVKRRADELYNDLKKNNIDVLFDDREDVTAGEKFADADLIGCPYRIVVSEKTIAQDSVEVKRREGDKLEMVKISELINWINF